MQDADRDDEREVRRWFRELPPDHPLVRLLHRLALARKERERDRR